MAEIARLDELADTLPPPAEAVDVGGDADAGVAAEPVEHPAETPEPPSSSEPADPLDRLLAEYDERNGAGNGAASSDDDIIAALDEANRDAAAQARNEQEFAAAQQRYAGEAAQSSIAIALRDRQVAELQQTVGQLQNAIAQEVQRQHQQRSLEDFEKLAAREQQNLAADVPGIDEDHVKRWMLSEGARDPNLVAAWEAKYYQPPGPVERARIASHIEAWGQSQAKLALQLPDPRARVLAQQNIEQSMRQMWETAFPDPQQHRAAAARYVKQALDRMHKEARRPRIDPQVSGDVLAVVQAMRGASTNKVPPEPPVNLGRLTEGEFRRHTMERYGF